LVASLFANDSEPATFLLNYNNAQIFCVFEKKTILNWQLIQVAILQEELEAKDLELGRLREMLSQKEATENRAVEEREEAGNDLNTASDPLQVKVEG